MPKLLPAPSVPVEAFLTPSEVLIRLRVNVRTLYRLMSHGDLPAVRIGRQWRVRPSDFELWLRRQEQHADTPHEPGLADVARGQHQDHTDVARRPVEHGVIASGAPR